MGISESLRHTSVGLLCNDVEFLTQIGELSLRSSDIYIRAVLDVNVLSGLGCRRTAVISPLQTLVGACRRNPEKPKTVVLIHLQIR